MNRWGHTGRFCGVSFVFLLTIHGQLWGQHWKLSLPLQPQAQPATPGQTGAPRKLNIVIIEGEGAINNIRQRIAREPIVQVEDENRRPVAGAIVTFFLPNQGAGGVFADGSRTLTVTTDAQGRAVARGIQPNNVQGKFEIRVSASHESQTASAVIGQTNMVTAAAAGAAAAGGISAKLIAILAIAGAAAVGGTAYAVTRNGDEGPAPRAPSVLTPGTPAVGPPR
jgi:hypothetical protein